MLRLKLKPVHIIAISCPVPVLSTIIYAMPDSAFKIWLFYSIRQIWVLFLCAAYFIILKKHPEPHFYGRKFRKMMTVYTTFIFLILAEDSFAIPNMKIVGNIIPWLNERNIMEDIMTIVVLVMVAKLVLDNQKENRQIRESILAAALEDRNVLTRRNLEIENELQALKAQIHENNKADEAYETAFINRYGLTAREADVLRLMIAGKSNPEIADELYISAGTVKFHAHQIYEKTGCQRRSQLIVLYSSGISKNA
ncbi:MAG: LuxR C-terminal-related transcriptional regulator [Clostridia bacterium]|nr:LuxR C-terminal-related transcriptional regulator [Clostridia bacterium]